MAQVFLTKRLAEVADAGRKFPVIEVASAGTAGREGLPASEHAREVVREDGASLEEFQSSALDRRSVEEADLILVMEPSHRDVVLRLAPEAADRTHLLRVFGGVGSEADAAVRDPFGGSAERYRQVYREIREAIEGGLPRLLDAAGSES